MDEEIRTEQNEKISMNGFEDIKDPFFDDPYGMNEGKVNTRNYKPKERYVNTRREKLKKFFLILICCFSIIPFFFLVKFFLVNFNINLPLRSDLLTAFIGIVLECLAILCSVILIRKMNTINSFLIKKLSIRVLVYYLPFSWLCIYSLHFRDKIVCIALMLASLAFAVAGMIRMPQGLKLFYGALMGIIFLSCLYMNISATLLAYDLPFSAESLVVADFEKGNEDPYHHYIQADFSDFSVRDGIIKSRRMIEEKVLYSYDELADIRNASENKLIYTFDSAENDQNKSTLRKVNDGLKVWLAEYDDSFFENYDLWITSTIFSKRVINYSIDEITVCTDRRTFYETAELDQTVNDEENDDRYSVVISFVKVPKRSLDNTHSGNCKTNYPNGE